MVSPTEGDPCCAPQHPPSPLQKDFDGIRDVNVSVSLMEDFMRCARVTLVCLTLCYCVLCCRS